MGDPLSSLQQAPLSQLARIMSWANRANGALMVLTGVLALFSGWGAFSSLLVSIYVGGFGALLLQYEFAKSSDMQRDLGFMYTYGGRAAFLLMIGNLSWACSPIGVYCALLTNANALFQGYILYTHPAFVENQASRFAIGGIEGDDVQLVSMAGEATFDPSSAAARARFQ